ncbi:MAG TPA: peptidoglycan DD-metalloendopeptidase family protein [Kofleriaceae bacterium]|jgi:murein DD-endopeptidase MepM/ murein hydrolase activator NlpD|nr:peptidoglycan DD-metalloendopeptidase family protein [Kofleriaceae bacterium]
MRRGVVALVLGFASSCGPALYDEAPAPPQPPPAFEPPNSYDVPAQPIDLVNAGVSVGKSYEFAFDGGKIEIELRRDGDHAIEIARNHYAVPVVMQWQLDNAANLAQLSPPGGVAILPAAPAPNGVGPPIVLTTARVVDPSASIHPVLAYHARFGDPNARPTPYAYRLPYRRGKTFSVLQGPHGAFSHRGSNEYAVDFDCPVATHVLAARDGLVVATNAGATGHGTTPQYLELARVNFVLVLHDDGTLGEYMHLSPSGVEVQPGQRVKRGDEIALSGNTGFSSTPHLHFQVMTAADDGVAARSFPFKFATAPDSAEDPIQSRAYPSWE